MSVFDTFGGVPAAHLVLQSGWRWGLLERIEGPGLSKRPLPNQTVDRHHLILDLLENGGVPGLELGNWARSALRVLLNQSHQFTAPNPNGGLDNRRVGEACRFPSLLLLLVKSRLLGRQGPVHGSQEAGTLVGPLQVLGQSGRRERGQVGPGLVFSFCRGFDSFPPLFHGCLLQSCQILPGSVLLRGLLGGRGGPPIGA